MNWRQLFSFYRQVTQEFADCDKITIRASGSGIRKGACVEWPNDPEKRRVHDLYYERGQVSATFRNART